MGLEIVFLRERCWEGFFIFCSVLGVRRNRFTVRGVLGDIGLFFEDMEFIGEVEEVYDIR